MKGLSFKGERSLVEIILSAAIFVAAAALLTHMFLTADGVSRRAEDMSHGVLKGQAALEYIKADPALSLFLSHMEPKEEGGRYLIFYDEMWQPCDGGGSFLMSVSVAVNSVASGSMVTARVEVVKPRGYIFASDEKKLLFSCESSVYMPDWAGRREEGAA